MTSMKLIFLAMLTLIVSQSFASGGGGGILNYTQEDQLKNQLNTSNNKEIIYNIGQKDGLIQFAYGKLVDKKWQIQKIEMLEVDLINDTSVMTALQDSKDLKSWAEIRSKN